MCAFAPRRSVWSNKTSTASPLPQLVGRKPGQRLSFARADQSHNGTSNGHHTRPPTKWVSCPLSRVKLSLGTPTTADHDRGGKLYDYRRINSVQEIALVASEQRHVEIWRRRGAKWEVEDLIGDSALALETVGIAIPFATIYADSGI